MINNNLFINIIINIIKDKDNNDSESSFFIIITDLVNNYKLCE